MPSFPERPPRAAGAESELLAHLVDLLGVWAPVTARRMFSGHGLFRDGVMFGLVLRETLHFKTDAGNRGDYEAAGMAPFTYARSGRGEVATSYHAVPAELLDDAETLAVWAQRAYEAALRRRREPRRKPGRRRET